MRTQKDGHEVTDPATVLKKMDTELLIQQLEKLERELKSNPHKKDLLVPSIVAIDRELLWRWRALGVERMCTPRDAHFITTDPATAEAGAGLLRPSIEAIMAELKRRDEAIMAEIKRRDEAIMAELKRRGEAIMAELKRRGDDEQGNE